MVVGTLKTLVVGVRNERREESLSVRRPFVLHGGEYIGLLSLEGKYDLN